MIEKIVLVRPGSYPEGLIIPLGLLYLASYVQKKIPDIEITILDAPLDDLNSSEIAEKLKELQPDLVGLTGLTVHTPYIHEAARDIRKALPEVVIIAGGPAVTSNAPEVLKEQAIDFGAIGEGEETFYDFVKCFQEGRDYSTIDGLVYRNQDGNIIKNTARSLIQDIDSIPYPAYHLIDVERYFTSPKRIAQSPVYISKRNIPVLTSRGCPYNCIYCHNTFGKKFRPRSPEKVVKEILWLKATYDFEELEIIDDIFNFEKERAKEIFRRLVKADLPIKIAFPNGVKYEMIDEELLILFKKAGVYRLAFGIESGNEHIQKIVRKKIDLVKMRDLIEQAVNMGFFVSGFFQLGLPGETKTEMLDTVNYAVSTKLHTAMFHLTIPFPGTPMYEEYIQGKIKASDFQSCQDLSVRDISVNLSEVSNKDLLKIKQYGFVKFYFNPKRMISIYKAFPVKRRLFYNFINVISEILFKKWLINT